MKNNSIIIFLLAISGCCNLRDPEAGPSKENSFVLVAEHPIFNELIFDTNALKGFRYTKSNFVLVNDEAFYPSIEECIGRGDDFVYKMMIYNSVPDMKGFRINSSINKEKQSLFYKSEGGFYTLETKYDSIIRKIEFTNDSGNSSINHYTKYWMSICYNNQVAYTVIGFVFIKTNEEVSKKQFSTSVIKILSSLNIRRQGNIGTFKVIR